MIEFNTHFSYETDVRVVPFTLVKEKLLALNIQMIHLNCNSHLNIYINNDIQLEVHNEFYRNVDSLCTISAFSYSQSNLGYGVNVGRYCSLASNITIMGATHFSDWVTTSPKFYDDGFHDEERIPVDHYERSKRRVNIGHDVWIGDNVLIGREVTIGHGAIIAANSVVTKDVAPYMIVGGVPAKIIRPRFDDLTIERLLKLQWWRFHKDDLKGLLANKPDHFIDGLNERIARGQIQEYHPKIYTLADLLA